MKINYKELVISIAISLGVGTLAAVLTRGNMDIYNYINTPPLSPPTWLFPIVWTILYINMGISSYVVYKVGGEESDRAIELYFSQLMVNFLWTIVFFNLRCFLFSSVLIVILDILIVFMILEFVKIRKWAGYLQIPYLLWVLFATYLNIGISILN